MKKKILIVLVCVALLTTLFCSCESSFVKEVESAPTEKVLESVNTTLSSIIPNDLAFSTIASSAKKGVVTIGLPEEAGADAKIKLYNDDKARQSAVLVSGLVVEDVNIDANIFYNNTELSIESSSFLGDKAYGVDFKTLYEDLSGWSIWEDAGVSFEEFDAEYGEQIKSLCDFITNPENFEDINKDELVKLLKKMNECVFDVYENTNSENESRVVVRYDFDTKDISDIINSLNNLYVEYAKKFVPDGADDNNLPTADEYFNLLGLKDYKLSATVYLDEATREIALFELSGNATESVRDLSQVDGLTNDLPYVGVPTKDIPVSFDFALDLTKKSYGVCKITSTSTHGEDSYTNTVDFTKVDTEDKTEYKVVAGAGEDSFETSLVANKADKTFKLEDSSSQFSVTGSYNVTPETLSVSINSISFNEGEDMKINVDVTFEKDAKVDFPESYTKITDLSLEELQEAFSYFLVTSKPEPSVAEFEF